MFRRLLLMAGALAALGVAAEEFMLGVDVFLRAHEDLLAGARVGLLTNQTGRNGAGQATADLLARHPKVKLVALFAPEHGIRGDVKAGEHFEDTVDRATGLPVYSLYGIKGHAPTDEMLGKIDVLVYDIQDVGSRAYTYIWSMAECLKACGRNGKTLVVFDRPNPLTCARVDGPVTEERWRSFLGLYPIPRVYGMTAGELARYFNSEYDLDCRLVVVPMAGYRRGSTWADTGIEWTASSPNIPSVESAICFAATGTIGTLGTINIGIGTRYPFQMVGAPWLDVEASAKALNALRLPGVQFLATAPFQQNGASRRAVFLRITDPAAFLPTTTEVAILRHLAAAYPKHFKWPRDRHERFDKAMGTSAVRHGLQRRRDINDIIASWRAEQRRFLERRKRYLLYPE